MWVLSKTGVAESVEMGVEMARVEWVKPPGLEKTYGKRPKSMEDDQGMTIMIDRDR